MRILIWSWRKEESEKGVNDRVFKRVMKRGKKWSWRKREGEGSGGWRD